MRVLLVSVNTEQIYMPVLPLGLACVSAAIQTAGHDVKLVNLVAKEDTGMVLKEAMKGFYPEIIGISVRNIDDQSMENPRFFLDSAKKVVSACQGLSDAPIILGGAGYSIFPQSALDYLGADMGIQGEGEMAFLTVLERLRQRVDLSGIPGLYLRERGLQGELRPTKNLDECPLPLPNVHMCLPSNLRDQKIWLPFQTRRGCSMKCSYCSTGAIEGQIMRKRSPDRVVEVISRYVEAGFDHFYFVDNTFNLPSSYAEALCDRLVTVGLNISWRCILYPRKVDEKLIEKMVRAGCKEVSLGIESGAKEILRSMNKKFQPEEVGQILGGLKNNGIHRNGFFLLGGPGENKETVEKSLSFADSLDLEAVKVTMGIRIYPGTSLAQTAIREGVIALDEDLLYPKFYMARGLEDWLRKTVHAWVVERPHWKA